ncbi:MAG: Na/Pi symporter [Calditrichia bacterium]|nr:Na/Pi symporter [Calditrichia bacterium]
MNFLKTFYNKYDLPLNILKLILSLYFFMFSLELMGTSLKMFGTDFAETLIQTTTNPLVGLFIGILATSLIQSSSSTTSIVVGMVGGGVLNVPNAIPIIMGANIGTSVTNSIVSLSQINRSTEFRRAFAAATVHDFFNVLAVIIIFPIQYFTNYLGIFAEFLGKEFQVIGGLKFLSPVQTLTKPLVTSVIQLIGDHAWILFVLSLILLLLALKQMVDALKILVVKKAEAWFDKYLFKTALRSFIVGLLLTFMVQSSSITTSLVVPMAGAGLLTLRQIFPYTLGANIGTTITAILAALVTQNLNAIIVAFSHLIFNISGIILLWPISFIPIRIAQEFSNLATKNKLIPIIYVIVAFFVIPITIIYFLR